MTRFPKPTGSLRWNITASYLVLVIFSLAVAALY